MPRTGGRQKGTLNKKTIERLQAAAADTPKGKHGGRKQGARNKATAARELLIGEAAQQLLDGLTSEAIEALTPRDVLRLVMTTGLKACDIKLAFTAAAELAPYCHPKLSAVAVAETDAQGFGKLLEVLEARRRKSAA